MGNVENYPIVIDSLRNLETHKYIVFVWNDSISPYSTVFVLTPEKHTTDGI